MTLYTSKLDDLIYLLENKPEIFTEEDKNSLKNLIDTLPDEIEEMANQIIGWYQDKLTIKEAFMTLLEKQGEVTAGMSKKPYDVTPEDYKATIKNAVRQKSTEQSSDYPKPPTP